MEKLLADTIYVGNLNWATTEQELIEFFEPYGKVASAKIIIDYHTKKSKDYGFVDMNNVDEAIEKLDGQELRGRSLKINKARYTKR